MPDAIDAACEATDDLIRLTEHKIKLLRDLKRSLRLCQLLGSRPGDVKGKLSFYVVESTSTFARWQGAIFVLRHDGDERCIPLKDVHDDLWPEDLLTARLRHEAHIKRRAQVRGS